MADDRDRRHADKRGGGEPPVWIEDELEAIEARWQQTSSLQLALPAETLFERQWAFAVVNRALDALAAAFADAGRRERVFRELRPFLLGGTGLPSRASARSLPPPKNIQ